LTERRVVGVAEHHHKPKIDADAEFASVNTFGKNE
jgi:hypothetical protein